MRRRCVSILNLAGFFFSQPAVLCGEEPPTTPAAVAPAYDWGRVRAGFTAGVVWAKDGGEFARQDLYAAFEIDKTWTNPARGRATWNTFFETRLTALPTVDTVDGSGGVAEALASRKAALAQMGVYAPVVVSKWRVGEEAHGLFVAPLAKAGVATLTGQDDVVSFFSLGSRLGHYRLSPSRDEAHRMLSYLDVTAGRFENFGPRRPWRLAVEGRLQVPATPFQIGFDANLGRGRDDLRFLFATRLNIAKLIHRLQGLSR